MFFEWLTCFTSFDVWLVLFLSCLHFLHIFSLLKIHVFLHLNTFLILSQDLLVPFDTYHFYWTFSRVFLNTSQYYPKYIKPIFQTFYLLNTSLIPSSIHWAFILDTSQYLLNLSRSLILYIDMVQPSFILTQTSWYNLAIDPTFCFSPKFLFQSQFWPIPSFNSLVSVLKLIISCFLMHFKHLDLRF